MIPFIRNKPVVTATVAATAFTLAALAGCAGGGGFSVGDLLGGASGVLDEETVAAGLKEALRVGTDRTVESTGRPEGFSGNPLIRIALPDELESAAGALRTIGLGGQVDRFELAMNRSAEKAAGEAADVFVGAITKMTLSDAMGILNGDDTAATDYFKTATSDELRSRFRPIVEEKMTEVGLYNDYNVLMDKYTSLPFFTKPVIDLDGYITEKSLAGLFTVLAGEEKKIRDEPAARTTTLLKKVFAKQ